VTDVSVADEDGGQVNPSGYHVARVEEPCDQRPDSARYFLTPALCETGRLYAIQ
jgi:hypothetical protein